MDGKDWDDPLHIMLDRSACIQDAKKLCQLLQDAKQTAANLGQNELAANIRTLLVQFAKKPLREIVDRQNEARGVWESKSTMNKNADEQARKDTDE